MCSRARRNPAVNAGAKATWSYWGQDPEHYHSLQCKHSSTSAHVKHFILLYVTASNLSASTQSETVLIQRVYTHFKKAPASHKLGVLYVVDSVTRAWVEQARKAGQTFGPSAPDGTFAAGVNRVTELLPSFMTDILTNCPEEQKVRFLETMLGAMYQLVISIGACTTVAALIYPHKKTTKSFFPPYLSVIPYSRIFLRDRLDC